MKHAECAVKFMWSAGNLFWDVTAPSQAIKKFPTGLKFGLLPEIQAMVKYIINTLGLARTLTMMSNWSC